MRESRERVVFLVYTSNFAKSKKYPKDILVSIARWQPKGCNLKSYPQLYPVESILRAYKTTGDWQEFERKYRKQLLALHPAQVAADLDGKILLCYEKSSDNCHRHVVRSWLKANGFACEEAD